jgi:probable rRNA maturation factor
MAELVDVIVEDDRWSRVELDALAQRVCAASLGAFGLDPTKYEIALLACDDTRIAVLNGDFRDKPQPTNVLSWPAQTLAAKTDGDMPEVTRAPSELGDIAISYDTCAHEATAQNKPLTAHISHLLAHATLHLLGFDHIRQKDAALMEGFEVKILASLGIADPY